MDSASAFAYPVYDLAAYREAIDGLGEWSAALAWFRSRGQELLGARAPSSYAEWLELGEKLEELAEVLLPEKLFRIFLPVWDRGIVWLIRAAAAQPVNEDIYVWFRSLCHLLVIMHSRHAITPSYYGHALDLLASLIAKEYLRGTDALARLAQLRYPDDELAREMYAGRFS